MAEDTRKSSMNSSTDAPIGDGSPPRRKQPKHYFPKTQAGKMWDAFGNPSEPVNEMPGGTYNSAGGKPKEVTWKDAFNWKLGDVKRFYKVPCARDALLVGVGGGVAVGGVTTIIGGLRAMRRAANLAAAGFAIISLGQYTWCESRRKEEAKGMALAVIGMKKLQEKKQREKEAEEAKKAEADRVAEEQRQKQKQKSSWGLW